MTKLLASAADTLGSEAVRSVAAGTATVSNLARAALSRAAEVEETVAAFRYLNDVAVTRRAKELDSLPTGTLRGLLVGVKDVIDTGDAPTAYGSRLFEGHRPDRDAEVVAALRGAGALLVGKTETTEFALFEPTRTRNPVDPSRTPGGSSSGSAAAVASGVVPVALGTQTAGSVLRPAAFCGVYGFKPTKGWASTAGIWHLAESLDTVGLFARDVADLRLLYDGLRRRGSRRRRRPTERTAAVLRASEWKEADDDAHAAIDELVGCLERTGWVVTDMKMPHPWRDLPEHHATVMAAEVAGNMHRILGERVSQISTSAQSIVERGDDTLAPQYLEARRATEAARELLPALEATVDVILAPTALGVAPFGLDSTGDPIMCRAWTLFGAPAASLPGYRRGDDLPVGVQAMSPAPDDIAFLEDLASIENASKERKWA